VSAAVEIRPLGSKVALLALAVVAMLAPACRCGTSPPKDSPAESSTAQSSSPATATAVSTTTPTPADAVDFTILQLNDVYEIAPVESGRKGGLARVATLLRRLEAENPNTIAVLSGDFLSPSAMGITPVDGRPVAGAQMVDTLNVLGLDYVTFGNHEFDLAEVDLVQRMSEAKFKWVNANVMQPRPDGGAALFPGSVPSDVVELKSTQGRSVRLGLIGVCLDMVKRPWLQYVPPVDAAKGQVAALKERADVIVALTHLAMADDKDLAAKVPELDVLMGGHEHEHAETISGDDRTPIYKADANAKSVYVHKFRWDTTAKKLTYHEATLVTVDDRIPEEEATALVVKKWIDKVHTALRAISFDPQLVVGKAKETLDGLESSIRNRQTNLSQLIAAAFADAAPEADAVIYGSGSIRIDDRILPGDIFSFDILRIFPFGGNLALAEVPGDVLAATLEQGEANKGTGGFLVAYPVSRDNAGKWTVKGQPLDAAKTYKILFNDFLLTGQERGLPFLDPAAEGSKVKKLRDTAPVRDLFIARLEKDMAERGGSP
jgi:5'-nucleotidase